MKKAKRLAEEIFQCIWDVVSAETICMISNPPGAADEKNIDCLHPSESTVAPLVVRTRILVSTRRA